MGNRLEASADFDASARTGRHSYTEVDGVIAWRMDCNILGDREALGSSLGDNIRCDLDMAIDFVQGRKLGASH